MQIFSWNSTFIKFCNWWATQSEYTSITFLWAALSWATPGWNWHKIKQMLSNTQRLNFSYLEIIHILHPCYNPKIIGHILKIKQKNKCVCIHEIIWLIIMKMKMKMKNRSHRYSINRPRSRHGHKYSKYKKYLNMMVLICIIRNTQATFEVSIYEKVKQHWGIGGRYDQTDQPIWNSATGTLTTLKGPGNMLNLIALCNSTSRKCA